MSGVNFSISAPAEVDGFVIDASGALDGQSLVYDGTSYSPQDIVPVGTIEMWAGGATAPYGWLLCDGLSYSWSQYPRLRNVIGISYGGSDEVSWNLPNLCSPSASVVTPVGIVAGGTRGSSNVLFSSGSIAHSHTHGAAQITSGPSNNLYTHSHTSGTPDTHVHGLLGANFQHQHDTGTPSGGHSHNYQRGNSGSSTTGNTNHGSHNYGTASHNHQHSANAASAGNHQHNLDSTSIGHTHNWTTNNVTSSLQGSNTHTHIVNAQPVYFIIKY